MSQGKDSVHVGVHVCMFIGLAIDCGSVMPYLHRASSYSSQFSKTELIRRRVAELLKKIFA